MVDSRDNNAATFKAGTEKDPSLTKETATLVKAAVEEGAALYQDDTVAKLFTSPSPTKCCGLPMYGPWGSQGQEGKSWRDRVFFFFIQISAMIDSSSENTAPF